MSMTTHDTPRVYVADLAAYNAGRLHGKWVDATDADEIREAIAEVLRTSPIPGAEEWAFHDYDGFSGLSLGEYEDVERVAELGALLEEHGPAFATFANYVGVAYADGEAFEDAFAGEWDSEEAFAEDLAEQLDVVPREFSWPQSYIDWERAARDLFMGDYWSAASPHGVYVFRTV